MEKDQIIISGAWELLIIRLNKKGEILNTGFIPHPIYPQKYDNNYTLFEVVNSTESITVLPSEQFDTTIYIKPVAVDRPEVWPTNGFATISGEVLYYDEVGYDQYTNKINVLKNA